MSHITYIRCTSSPLTRRYEYAHTCVHNCVCMVVCACVRARMCVHTSMCKPKFSFWICWNSVSKHSTSLSELPQSYRLKTKHSFRYFTPEELLPQQLTQSEDESHHSVHIASVAFFELTQKKCRTKMPKTTPIITHVEWQRTLYVPALH